MKRSGAGLESVSSRAAKGAVLKCPADAPFIPTLAAAVLNGSVWNDGAPAPHELPGLTIYLPSRAAVEPLKLAFLAHAPNGATFLPRIHVLGDTSPLELFSAFGPRMASTEAALDLLEQALAVPPAFSDLERQIELTALVLNASGSLRSTKLAPGERLFAAVPAASAFSIAGEIAALIDEAHSEAADLSRIAMLDGAYASGSEQLSLQLLRATLRGWQAHKAKTGKLEREERRNRLMAIEAEFIRASGAPVIIAGSTGSVAATMGLMEAALARPQSAIVLCGLDDALDVESWAAAGEHPEHPQYGLHRLLARLNVRREDIRALSPVDAKPKVGSEPVLRRAAFLSEALLPAPATAKWAGFIENLKEGGAPMPGVSLIEAESLQDEAAVIALILRESLETNGQTAALVTPSDGLMSRVRHALAQWCPGAEMPVNPSGGDDFAARIVSCAATAKPEDMVELLRQGGAKGKAEIRRIAETVDLGVLRQMWRPSSLAGIPAALSRAGHAISAGEARHPALKRIAAAEWETARSFAAQLIEVLSPLTSKAEKRLPLADWIAAHAEVQASLEGLGLSSGGPADEENAILRALSQAASAALTLDLEGYAGLFREIALSRSKPRLESPHPRLFLWKPLDARLLTADVLVLGGLNEGCWPQQPGPDPWLNRRDRAFAGLPPQERRIGQAAHDFATLAASAPCVILTRSKKVNGSLARPSRWVSRIKALAAGAGQADSLKPDRPWLAWAAALRAPGKTSPAARPQPRPPLAARPRRLSVTAIETWFANPYAIYARHILGLEPLRGPGETSDARDKGILYHAALHSFFQAYPAGLPQDAAAELLKRLDKAAGELGFNLENAPFWRPRFARFASWFAETEADRRADVQVLKSEVGGKLKLDAPAGPFEITARADRIDRAGDGSIRIYDFKTSANAAKVSARRGAPQLALEGFLAREGAFAGIPAGRAPELYYIVATGGEPPGEIVTLKVPSAEAIEAAYTGTMSRIARFDDEETAYTYEMRAIFQDKAENDPYAHLARVQEWAAGADEAEADDD